MSGAWLTYVYFEPMPACPPGLFEQVVSAYVDKGCVYATQLEGYEVGHYGSLDGSEFYSSDDLYTALGWLAEKGSGCIQLWYPAEAMEFLLYFNPTAHGIREDKVTPLGYMYLWLPGTYLWGEQPAILSRRFELVYEWSKILTTTMHPLYGWGDLDRVGDRSSPILTSDIVHRQIPRFSWWSYFSREYVEQIGRGRLSTAAAWLDQEDENGLTVILRPPTIPAHASA